MSSAKAITSTTTSSNIDTRSCFSSTLFPNTEATFIFPLDAMIKKKQQNDTTL